MARPRGAGSAGLEDLLEHRAHGALLLLAVAEEDEVALATVAHGAALQVIDQLAAAGLGDLAEVAGLEAGQADLALLVLLQELRRPAEVLDPEVDRVLRDATWSLASGHVRVTRTRSPSSAGGRSLMFAVRITKSSASR